MPFDESHWSACRKLMALNPAIANLNAGTLSPTPLPIIERCSELRKMQADNPSDFLWRQTPPLIDRSREALAKYLNCHTRDLLLLPNVTNALNAVIRSIDLPAGSEILTTNHEYGAILNAWKVRAEEKCWTIRTFEIPHLSDNPADYVGALAAAVGPQTRVLFFSHVACTTGLLLPAQELCDEARKHDLLTVIDGAHAPGGTPVDLTTINADFYGANLHKWVMCPAGAGFLHVQSKHHRALNPAVISWGYPYDFAKADEPSGAGGSKFHFSLEYQGVSDRVPQMVVPEVLSFRESLGGEGGIHARVRDLGDYALDTIGKILRPAIPRHVDRRGPLVSFEFPPCDPVATRNRLYHQFQVECPITQAGVRFFLRISTAWFNSTYEIDRLGEAIGALT